MPPGRVPRSHRFPFPPVTPAPKPLRLRRPADRRHGWPTIRPVPPIAAPPFRPARRRGRHHGPPHSCRGPKTLRQADHPIRPPETARASALPPPASLSPLRPASPATLCPPHPEPPQTPAGRPQPPDRTWPLRHSGWCRDQARAAPCRRRQPRCDN